MSLPTDNKLVIFTEARAKMAFGIRGSSICLRPLETKYENINPVVISIPFKTNRDFVLFLFFKQRKKHKKNKNS